MHDLETGIAPKRELRGVFGGAVFLSGVFSGGCLQHQLVVSY